MPPQPNALEDLVVENRRSHPEELMVARGAPRDEQATAELKADEDRMARLAELAEVKPDKIADVAVRGTNVTFQVADTQGALSAGFFPLTDLDAEDPSGRGHARRRRRAPQAPKGGPATVPSVTDPGRGESETGQQGDLRTGGAESGGSTPDDLDELNARDTVALFSDDTVDKNAVLKHELARSGDGANDGPRKSVLDAARKAGLNVPES